MPSEFGAPFDDPTLEPTRVYAAADVDRYIGDLSAEVADLRRRLDEAVRVAGETQARLGSVEQAEAFLGRALLTAQRAADSLLADANQRATTRLAEAESWAAATIAEAHAQSQQILADATTRADARLAEADHRAETVMADIEQRSGTLIAEAEHRSAVMIAEAEQRAADTMASAQREAEQVMDAVRAAADQILSEAHETVDALFAALRAIEEPNAPEEHPSDVGAVPATAVSAEPDQALEGGSDADELPDAQIVELPSPEQAARYRQAGGRQGMLRVTRQGEVASGAPPWMTRRYGGPAADPIAVDDPMAAIEEAGEPEAHEEALAVAEAEPELEPTLEAEPEAVAEPELEPTLEAEAEPELEPTLEAEAEPELEPTAEAEAEPEHEDREPAATEHFPPDDWAPPTGEPVMLEEFDPPADDLSQPYVVPAEPVEGAQDPPSPPAGGVETTDGDRSQPTRWRRRRSAQHFADGGSAFFSLGFAVLMAVVAIMVLLVLGLATVVGASGSPSPGGHSHPSSLSR